MTYLLMNPVERPQGWNFDSYYIYLTYDVETLFKAGPANWYMTKAEKEFVSYAKVRKILDLVVLTNLIF